jgi:hypothetical protein
MKGLALLRANRSKNFIPRNLRLLRNHALRSLLRHRRRSSLIRGHQTNIFLLRKHLNGKLRALVGTVRQLLYGRHLYLCGFVRNLFLESQNCCFGQGLVAKTSGFVNFKLFLAGQKLNHFLLARKDLRYLVSYSANLEAFEPLLSGGYTFFIYAPDSSLAGLDGVYNLFIRNARSLGDGAAVKHVKFYPLIFRVGGYTFYRDHLAQFVHDKLAKLEERRPDLAVAINNLVAEQHFERIHPGLRILAGWVHILESFFRLRPRLLFTKLRANLEKSSAA